MLQAIPLDDPTRRGEQVMRDILSYFVRHPQAADTLEGIVRFRVLDELVHRGVPETEAALEQLVRQGLLRRDSVPGSGVLYRIGDAAQLEAAQRALAASPGTPSPDRERES